MPRLIDRLIPGASRQRVNELEAAVRQMSWAFGKLSQFGSVNLAEQFDQQTLDYMIRHLSDARLGGDVTTHGEPDNEQRKASVRQCRQQFYYDPLLYRIINLWTDFGFGLSFSLIAQDPEAQKVWDEYLDAKRNRKIIGKRRRHILSNRLLVDGEFY